MDWENNRQAEIESLTKSGKLPIETETKDREDIHPLLMGNVAAMIHVSTFRFLYSSDDSILTLPSAVCGTREEDH